MTVQTSPGYSHGGIASEIERLLGNFIAECDKGVLTILGGQDKLADVASVSKERAPATGTGETYRG